MTFSDIIKPPDLRRSINQLERMQRALLEGALKYDYAGDMEKAEQNARDADDVEIAIKLLRMYHDANNR